ncbi:MAG TPA: carboxypeptidase-like regulatory domain-containing protein [Bryobacteraceae bacterium]
MTRTSRSTWTGVVLLTSLFLFSGSQCKVEAQATAVAQVSGTVTDATGAAIVNAQVTMTETSKNLFRAVATDTSGRYTLPNLPVGPYRLEVKSQGFKNYVQDNIQLVVNNNIEINVPMQVGAASERVEVSAIASMVETKETSVASVIDQKRISELPLNGRQATQLIITLGAAVYGDAGDTGSKTFYSSTRISVAGGQGNGTAYLLDGGDHTDAMSNVNMPLPFPDALQEFSIETSAVSSRFGTHPGATVNAVTRSGSNSFHGNLFEYLRNGNVNARNFFAATSDSLKRNQFGGTAGGRIIKDKLFFFGGYQGTRNRQNPPTSTTFIPNAAMLAGDLTTFASGACQSSAKTLTAPYAGNRIPVSAMNPIAVNIATTYLPYTAADRCGKVTYAIPITGDENQYIGRIDWIQNEKHTLYGRYFVDGFQNPPTYDGKNLLTTTQAGNLELAQSATIGDTYLFGPGTLNSFHLTFNRRRDDRGPTDIPINPTMLGINIYSAVPNFLLLSTTGGFSTFCGTCAPGHFNVNSYQVADDVDVIRGKHQIGFGFNLIRVQNNTISGFNENGNFAFNSSRTGLGLADFLAGLPSDFVQTNATPDDLRQWIMSFYVQDSFKMSPRLTLNYGIRWVPTFPNPDKYKRGSSFNINSFYAGQFSTVYPNAPAGLFFPGDKGIPDANWNGRLANFAPRVGIAWNPHGDGRDTLRMGASILYDVPETWFNERETTNAPIGTSIDTPNPIGGFSDPWLGYPGGNPFPTGGRAYFPATAGVYVNMPLNPKSTYVANWNITYERQVGTWLASISYLGNKTTHLWSNNGEMNPAVFLGLGPCTLGGKAFNPCSSTSTTQQRRLFTLTNPTFGPSYASMNTMDDGAVAHYNGMLLKLEHRFANNFTFLANYTLANCISDTDFGAALATPGNSQPFNRHADWGPCVSDTRHNFNVSLVATSSLKTSRPWVNRLLSDWQIAPLIHASSGQPLNVTVGKDNSLTGLNNDRPNLVLADTAATNPICNNGTTACHQYLNPAAFSANALGTYGNLGHNALRGPSTVNFDAAISRLFSITERYRLQARVDAFNVLNHTNFVGAISPAGTVTGYQTLDTNMSSGTFGRARSAFDPRIFQFSMKFIF